MQTDLVIEAPAHLVVNRLFQLSEQAITCFHEADRWAFQGYAHLFDIYELQLWRDESDSWEGWLRSFVFECRNRGVVTVSMETLQQRTRDYVRLVAGAGLSPETVLALPARVANSIGKLGTWPRQGTLDYDTEKEGKLHSLSPAVRDNAINAYGLAADASDTAVLREIVGRLAEAPSAMAGVEEIDRLLRADQNYSDYHFFVSVVDHRIHTRVSMTTYRDGHPAAAWDGALDQDNVPEAVLVEYAKRLGTHLAF